MRKWKEKREDGQSDGGREAERGGGRRERAREGESGIGRGIYLERDSLEKDVENERE